MASKHRLFTLFPMAVAAGLLLASCGSAGTVAPPAAATGTSVGIASAAAAPPAGQSVQPPAGQSVQPSAGQSVQPSAGQSVQPSAGQSVPPADSGAQATGGDTAGGGTGYDKTRTAPLKLSLRVANLYTTGAGPGPALEVWIGSRSNGGKKLATVPYGRASTQLPGEMMDPMGQGVPTSGAYLDLSFYPAGAAADAEPIFTKQEEDQDGLALTVVITPPGSEGERAGGRVFADAIGAAPASGGFSTLTVPAPTAGKATLLIDALALGSGKAGADMPGLLASTTTGSCLPYFDPSETGLGVGSTLHDMNSDVVDMIGGTSYQVFPVEPGARVQIHLSTEGGTTAAACRATPILTFDPQLAAGKRGYALLYGPSPAAAKVLLLPAG